MAPLTMLTVKWRRSYDKTDKINDRQGALVTTATVTALAAAVRKWRSSGDNCHNVDDDSVGAMVTTLTVMTAMVLRRQR